MKIAEEVAQIIDRLEKAGYEAYAVGGSVRDALLGREPGDWDVATSASAETVVSLFPRTARIGAKFGIVKVMCGDLAVDVAAYRIDGAYSDCRRPDRVTFTGSLDEDLKRRDFTINAMAYSPIRGFADPFGGREDLAAGLVRAVGDPRQRFREDALRIMRGVRFAAQLGFAIEEGTMEAMAEHSLLLSRISMERIRDEFFRILSAPYADKGLRLCDGLGLFPYILGEGFDFSDKSSRDRLEYLIAGVGDVESDPATRLALLLLCGGTGKAEAAIEKLKLDNATSEALRQAAALTGEVDGLAGREELKDFISLYGYKIYMFCEKLAGIWAMIGPSGHGQPDGDQSGARHQRRLAWLEEIRRAREPVLLADLAVSGRDLLAAGFERGNAMGAVLGRLLEHVHRNPKDNVKELLIRMAVEYAKETHDREKGNNPGRHIL